MAGDSNLTKSIGILGSSPRNLKIAYHDEQGKAKTYAWGYDTSSPRSPYPYLKNLLKGMLKREGYTDVYSGMSLGPEQILAEAALELKQEGLPVRLHCQIPNSEYGSNWKDDSKQKFQEILSQADDVQYLTQGGYSKAAVQAQQEAMGKVCDTVISVLDPDDKDPRVTNGMSILKQTGTTVMNVDTAKVCEMWQARNQRMAQANQAMGRSSVPTPSMTAPRLTPEQQQAAKNVLADKTQAQKIASSLPQYLPGDQAIQYLAPYLSKEDMRIVQKSLDANSTIKGEALGMAIQVAEYFRNEGIEFVVAQNSYRNQLEVKMVDSPIKVRLFDNDNPNYIGRVSDGRRFYYYTSPSNGRGRGDAPLQPTLEDRLNILKFVRGEYPAQIYQNKSRSRSNIGTEEYNYWAALPDGSGGIRKDMVLSIETNGRQELPFTDADGARQWLSDSIAQAKENFEKNLNIEEIIRAVDGDDEPRWSIKDNFAGMQMNFYDTIFALKAADEEGTLSQIDSSNPEDLLYDYEITKRISAADWKDYTRQLAQTFVDEGLGSLENGFNPVYISDMMENGYSSFRNNSVIVDAVRMCDYSLDKITGTDFYRNRLVDQMVKFDESTARGLSESAHPLEKKVLHTVVDTLVESGMSVDVNDIKIDDQGIISWKAVRNTADRRGVRTTIRSSEQTEISGTLGQVFLPDDMGFVETKYAGSDNYLTIPGYEARVLDGDEPFMDRIRLRSYEDVVLGAVRQNLRADLMTEGPEFARPNVLNRSYSHLYERRYPLDFKETTDLSHEELAAIAGTLSRRVKFPNGYLESTSRAHLDAERGVERGDKDLTTFSYYKLTGEKNLALLEQDSFGSFDKWATSTAKNQGLVRYLTSDTKVVDGKIVGGVSDFTDVMELDLFRHGSFNAWDRNNMPFNQFLTAKKIDRGANVAMMNFGGWNFDDCYIVSKGFAERNAVADSTGKHRVLQRGDKISDFNGNKGVISLVIDPDMTPEEAAAVKPYPIPYDLVEFFKQNGGLDVVGGPYSSLSRFNGGLIRGMSESPQDLYDPVHDRTIPGGMGKLDMIITDMTVDEKTHLYDGPGEGRKFSGQLAWACASQDCPEILKEVYGHNDGAFDDFREYLISVGLDISATGELQSEYVPHHGEERRHFGVEILRNEERGTYDRRATERSFMDRIAHTGGVLDLPFPLQFPNHNQTFDNGDGTWGLPVLSSDLRSDRQVIDGRLETHDFTNHYAKIYLSAVQYKLAEEKAAAANEKLAEARKTRQETGQNPLSKDQYERLMRQVKMGSPEALDKFQSEAQASFNAITNQIIEFQIDGDNGKHSFIRDHIMGKKMPDTATGVAISDPRLPIDCIGVNSEMLKTLNVKEGDYVLLWRDPILKDGGMRYVRTVLDESVVGFSINPIGDQSYGMDFDGDSCGLMKLHTKAARDEAMRKFSVEANLLNFGQPQDGNGNYPLYFQKGMDFASAEYQDPGLGDFRREIQQRANDTLTLPEKERLTEWKDCVRQLNDYCYMAYTQAICTDVLQCDTVENTVHSLEDMVLKGCKGSDGKLKELCKYLGVTYDGVCGEIENIQDHGRTLSTDEDRINNQLANAVKVSDTGVAGGYSQRLISIFRNTDPKMALELTEQVTQGCLDVKHNSEQARIVDEVLMDSLRKVYAGKVYENGRSRQMTVDEFKDAFYENMNDKLGVSPNPVYVDKLVSHLENPDGTVKGIQDLPVSTMDRIAYGGGYDALCEAAGNHENLFEGKYTNCFAPKAVREGNPNQMMVKQDVLSESKLREIDRLSEREGPSLESVRIPTCDPDEGLVSVGYGEDEHSICD